MKLKVLLKNLVEINSVSGKEKELSDYLIDYLASLGLQVERVGLNLLIYVKGKESKNCLIFNSHIDTVDPGDINKWESDPYTAVEKNGKIYGVGSIDDKASVAAMINLVEEVSKNKIDSDVYLMLAVNEEIDGAGTKETLNYMIKNKLLSKYDYVAGIVGEPTCNDSIKIAHRGSIFMQIEFKGDSGHSSKPNSIKVNANIDAAKFVMEQDELNKILKQEYNDELLGAPTVCVTNFKGISGSSNKVADKSTVTLDIRTNLKFKENSVKFIEQHLPKNARIITKHKDLGAFIGYTSIDSKIVKIFKGEFPALKVGKAEFATDMCFFTENKIDAVIIGPGSPNLIHKANENIEIKELDKAKNIYLKIATAF